MEYENLWNIPATDNLGDSTENVVSIMRQQAQYLKTGTTGKILGKFSKIKNVIPSMAEVIAALPTEQIEGDETRQLADANSFYRPQKYGFEIYNQSYKFRILEINLSPLYPILVSFDEGVLEDTKEELCYCGIKNGEDATQFIIRSDEELIESLRIVLSSKKIKYILYKLQQN